MSLYKQLWLAIIGLLVLVFAGTLLVHSHSHFTDQELLDSAKKTAVVFLLAMLVAGALGSYLLKRLLRSLDDIAEQAEAIGDKRFITNPEPATVELRKLATALNSLSLKIKSTSAQGAAKPQKTRMENHVDKVTGLLDRNQFVKVLTDNKIGGVLSIVHLTGLSHLNRIYGRKATDGMLAAMGHALNSLRMQNSGWAASRLNGSDFAILAPQAVDPMTIALETQAALREALVNRAMDARIQLPGATTIFAPGEAISDMLTRLDGALTAAVAEGESTVNIANRGDIQVAPVREQLETWRDIFRQAFIEHKFSLTAYPVAGLEGELLHLESPARLQWQNESLTASQFLPWINRLELASDLDKQVVDLALRQIETEGKPVCINLSVASVADSGFLSWLSEKLSSHEAAAGMLWMEIQEAMAYRYLENFKKLCIRAKSHGARMGIEHMGHRLSDIGRLTDTGLDYMKIDAVFIRDIDQNTANQTLVRTLCSIGNAIGVTTIAEGVCNEAEWNTLKEIGVDGVTGPGVRIPGQDGE